MGKVTHAHNRLKHIEKPKQKIEIFFSYAHKDEELRDELAKHLTILKRQGVIMDWYDRKIGAGTEWRDQINKHLNTASLILLLISADFLASDYCRDTEVDRAMKRGNAREARVIPIILRACLWQREKFGKLQALPKDGKPVTSWANRDEAFYDITKGIEATVVEMTAKPPTPVFEPTKVVSERTIYTKRRLPDSKFSLKDREILVEDSKRHAQKFVPDSGLQKKICEAARVLLKKNRGKSLSKRQLEQLDERFLAGGLRKPDAEIARWVLRAARLHPQGRVVR
jgi:hypothetical protein